MRFANFDADVFLQYYWQKKPLLIRNPWVAWENPLEPDELAGLACEDGVESRLIIRAGGTLKLEHGPIPEKRFGTLGKAPWTLLVQAVDNYVPEVAALIAPFRFIPNWRIDDVMVSYASDDGGVGPHFDQYDVFLIQGLGKRRWQIGALCDDDIALLPHDDLRLLADFNAEQEWILEPGDMLYLPPRISHNGVAVGDDCMTYSIGFRAPARSALIADWSDDVAQHLSEDDRYSDPDLQIQANPGEITADSIAKLQAMITQKLGDMKAFARWFGEYNSTPRYPDADWRPETPIAADELRQNLSSGAPIQRNPASRFSFIRESADTLLLFVDGQSFECAGESMALAEHLCAQDHITVKSDLMRSDAAVGLIITLFNQGSLVFEQED